MANNSQRLVWLDMEMSGLDPEKEKILEVALVVTEADLSIVAEAPVFVIHQSDAVLEGMDKWNTETHGRTGLTAKVRASTMTEAEAEKQLLSFLKQHVAEKTAPLCGNSVSQDRRFMYKYMPALEAFLHYRTVDVSTFKELAKRWRPDVYKSFRKKARHEALADIHESIDELKHYRTHFIQMQA